MMKVIDVPDFGVIAERLHFIFPEGTENRNYLVREISASTIFVMFYAGAIFGTDIWIRPDQITKMTDKQSKKLGSKDRGRWTTDSLSPGKMKNVANRWYSVNTRESIRDETIRTLLEVGAVVERQGIPTTSSKPRYGLAESFASLFANALVGVNLANKIGEWQENNLSKSALARLQLMKYTSQDASSEVWVKFPNGETRKMAAGKSSHLSKAVIEEFSKKFLQNPAVVFLSESKIKVVSRDDVLSKRIGLRINAEKNLPDIILADIGPKHPVILFVEVVSTDGPISANRKSELLKIAAGYKKEQVAFLTVFDDRNDSAFKRASSVMAWGSFVWFASEPDYLMSLIDKSNLTGKKISDLL